MKQYLETLQHIKDHGVFKGDRTGTGTQSYFGMQQRYSLRNNTLPVVTTKKIHLHSVIHELIWMLSGNTNVDYLIANGVRIWNEWVKPETAVYEEVDGVRKLVSGDLGPIYSKMWRSIDDTRIIPKVEFTSYLKRGFKLVADLPSDDKCVVHRQFDQIQDIINQLQDNPDSRRIILDAWRAELVEDQALPACHAYTQFWTRELTSEERVQWMVINDRDAYQKYLDLDDDLDAESLEFLDSLGLPSRAISCQMYQRSH